VMMEVSDSGVEELSERFGELSNNAKSQFILSILPQCGPDQKWLLQQRLPAFLFRDFFLLLPDEVLEMVLSYLDPLTLLRARQVSKIWRDKLHSPNLKSVWTKVAGRVGAAVTASAVDAASDLRIDEDSDDAATAASATAAEVEETAAAAAAATSANETPEWVVSCSLAIKLRAQIKSSSCFSSFTLAEVIKGDAQVTSIDVIANSGGDVIGNQGGGGDVFVLALANQNSDEVTSDTDCILLWSFSKQKILRRLKVLAKVCVVKSDPTGSSIVSGHSNGTITVYHLPTETGGGGGVISGGGSQLIGSNFQAHSASIFSLEINKSLNLIASGSADKTVKFWATTTTRTTQRSEGDDDNVRGRGQQQQDARPPPPSPPPTFVKCMSDFSHWVVKVHLFDPDLHQVTRFRDQVLLFSMTKDYITLHTWAPCTCHPHHPHCHLTNLAQPVYSIPLCTGKAYGFRDIFFTPGLHLYGDNLGFVKQMPMFETHTIGDADIVVANANDGQTRKTIHVNKKVRKLLGIGKRFALLLLPYVDNRYKNVVIVDLNDKKIVGGFTVPHSRPYTPEFSQIAIGDTKWLDGLSREACTSRKGPGQVLMTLATNYEHLHLVQWKGTAAQT